MASGHLWHVPGTCCWYCLTWIKGRPMAVVVVEFVCKRWTPSASERSVCQSVWWHELFLRIHQCWSCWMSVPTRSSWSGEMARMSTCYATFSRCDATTMEGVCHFDDYQLVISTGGLLLLLLVSEWYWALCLFCSIPASDQLTNLPPKVLSAYGL